MSRRWRIVEEPTNSKLADTSWLSFSADLHFNPLRFLSYFMQSIHIFSSITSFEAIFLHRPNLDESNHSTKVLLLSRSLSSSDAVVFFVQLRNNHFLNYVSFIGNNEIDLNLLEEASFISDLPLRRLSLYSWNYARDFQLFSSFGINSTVTLFSSL